MDIAIVYDNDIEDIGTGIRIQNLLDMNTKLREENKGLRNQLTVEENINKVKEPEKPKPLGYFKKDSVHGWLVQLPNTFDVDSGSRVKCYNKKRGNTVWVEIIKCTHSSGTNKYYSFINL